MFLKRVLVQHCQVAKSSKSRIVCSQYFAKGWAEQHLTVQQA